MKKMKSLLGVAFIAISLFFVACTPTSNVTLTVSPLDVAAAPGETVSFKAILTPDVLNGGSLGAFSITDADNNELYTQTFSGTQSDSAFYDYTVASDATLGDEIFLTFSATDGTSKNTRTVTAIITVATNTPVLVDAKDKMATYTSTTLSDNFMYVLGSDAVTMDDGYSTTGDLAFVWQNTYGYSVVSPDCPWITELYSYNSITYSTADKQNTKIMTYTGNWADLTAEVIDGLTITSETVASANGDGNGVQGLNEGDIVVYETADGRKGALLVKTNAKVTMYMTADLLYQGTSSAGK